MSSLFNGSMGQSGVDTGDIPASLRFRGAQHISKTLSAPTSNTSWALSMFVRRGQLSAWNTLFSANTTGNSISFNPSDQLVFAAASSVVATSTALFRDPTSFFHLFVRSNGTNIKAYRNNEEILSYTGTIAAFNSAVVHSIFSANNGGANFTVGYGARIAFVDNGGSLLPTDFIRFNTEINEWVSKSQSAVKAVVDAGGTNSFMLDFDDPNFATYNVGKDYSSKGNHWTPNNFSLTAGTSYDWMLDVPGNTYCTASEIDKGANPASTTLTEAGLKSACSAVAGGSSVCGTMGIPAGKFYFELTPTAIGNGLILGITSRTSGAPSGSAVGYVFDGTKNVAGSGGGYSGNAYVANDIIGVAVDTVNNTIEFFKNNASQGVITNSTYIVPGCKPLHWNNSSSGSSTVQHNYGQAPLHASAAYRSAAGGYFRYAPPTGYKALCQANMPDVALPSGNSVSVAVRTTANSIDSSLASARSGWSGYVDIKKVADIADTWAWQFSHDSSNEYAVMASSISRAAKRSFSGSNPTVGHSIRIGSEYGTTAGSVSHVNGVGEVVTHNLGGSRWAVLVFSRIGSCQIYHSSFPAGYFAYLHTTGVLSNAGGFLSSVTSNSFTIDSTTSTKTLDYLVLSDVGGGISIGSYTGAGATTDNAYAQLRGKAGLLFIKRASTSVAANNVYLSAISNGNNVAETALRFNTDESEATVGTTYDTDITAFGIKSRASNVADVSAADTYAYIALLDVLQNYSLAR